MEAAALPAQGLRGHLQGHEGLPVTVRLLDPPLHEFVPARAKDQQEMAKRLGVPPARSSARVKQLHEFNPMLGHRGCRLSITYPELCEDADPGHHRSGRLQRAKKKPVKACPKS
jgi:pyruvate, orthophosphate dikinase